MSRDKLATAIEVLQQALAENFGGDGGRIELNQSEILVMDNDSAIIYSGNNPTQAIEKMGITED